MSKREEIAATGENNAAPQAEVVPRKGAKEAKIYLGPSFSGAVEGTVYNNGLPPALEEAVKKMPAIGELAVPISRAAEAMKELAKPDSAMRKFYQKALNYGKGE